MARFWALGICLGTMLAFGALKADAEPVAYGIDLLGGFFPTAPRVMETPHFRLIHDDTSEWAQQTGVVLESVYRRFYVTFQAGGFDVQEPVERLTWICFPAAQSFDVYARNEDGFDASRLGLYYSARTNRVAFFRELAEGNAFPDLLALSHEGAHQLSYNSGLLVRGATHPAWVTEGLATNFEYSQPHDAQKASSGLDGLRQKTLLEAKQDNRLVPLAQFVTMTQFRPGAEMDVRDLYAQAQGFFQFLLAERPAAFKSYLKRMADKGVGRRAEAELLEEFVAEFGSPELLESAWWDSLGMADSKWVVLAGMQQEPE